MTPPRVRCQAEEEVHRLEGVPWPKDLEYHDNQGCIDLLSKRLLLVLDECSELKNCS